MSLAALTPLARVFLLCDEVVESEVEEGVYTLEGVREQVVVDSFPHWRSVSAFMVRTYLRGGTFTGMVKLVNDETGEVIQKSHFRLSMDVEDGVSLPLSLGACIFPTPGRYTGELWFFGSEGHAIQKGQRSLLLIQRE